MKLPKGQIKGQDLIPDTFVGHPTDVIEMGDFKTLTHCLDVSDRRYLTYPCGSNGKCYRPMPGGASTGYLPENDPDPFGSYVYRTGGACALGVIVRDKTDGSLVGLTNNHCGPLLCDPDFPVHQNITNPEDVSMPPEIESSAAS